MKVDILGAGFAGLVLAHWVAKLGHTPVVHGKTNPEFFMGRGPKHLWWSRPAALFAMDLLDDRRVFDTNLIKVRWATDHDLMAYFRKTGKNQVPCRGVESFLTFRNQVDAALYERLVAKYRPTGREVTHKLAGFKAVISTLPNSVNESIFNTGLPRETSSRDVYYTWTEDPPRHQFSDDTIYYNAGPHDSWYRSSFTPAGWCQESAVYTEGCTKIRVTTDKYLDTEALPFVPAGRSAEGDNELMISDLMEGGWYYADSAVRRARRNGTS